MGIDHGLLAGLVIFYGIATLTFFAALACEFFSIRRRSQLRLVRFADASSKAWKLLMVVMGWTLFTASGGMHLYLLLNSPLEDGGKEERIGTARMVLFTMALCLVKMTWIPAGTLTRRGELMIARVLNMTARVSVGVIAALGIAMVVIVGVMENEWKEFGEHGETTAKALAPATVVMVLDLGTWILAAIISLLYALHFTLSLVDKLGIFLMSLITSCIVACSITTYTFFLTRHPTPHFPSLLLTAELSLALLITSLPSLYIRLARRETSPPPNIESHPSPTDFCFPGGTSITSTHNPAPPTIEQIPISALPGLHMQAFISPSIAAFPEPEDVLESALGLQHPSLPLRPRSTAEPGEAEQPIDWDIIQQHLGVLPDVLPDMLSSFGSQATVSERSESTGSMSELRRDAGEGVTGTEQEDTGSRVSRGSRRSRIASGRGVSESRSRRQSKGPSQSGSGAPRKVVVIQGTGP